MRRGTRLPTDRPSPSHKKISSLESLLLQQIGTAAHGTRHATLPRELYDLTPSWPKRAKNQITASLVFRNSLDQGRPCRIRRIAWGLHPPLIPAGNVDRPDGRPTHALGSP